MIKFVVLLGVLLLVSIFTVCFQRGRTWKAVVLFTLALIIIWGEVSLGGSLASLSEPKTAVIAHRAGAAQAPENTLSALEAAIAAGADAAEIDVQQTRDGVLIAMHDDSFQRTAGLDRKVWDTDYDAVRELDAGSWFSPRFSGERIPTLKEMLSAADGRIQLMIELKSTGHERQMVEETVKLIQSADMEEQCMVASMDLSFLQRAKELAPELETVYITSSPSPELYELSYVDGFSVENSILTEEMVSQIRQEGKKVYGWTVNEATGIKRMALLGIDGVVTDDPALAKRCLEA